MGIATHVFVQKTTLWLVFAAFLAFAPLVSARLSTGAGVAGLGRSLFTPTCCYACLNSFWALNLPCSQPDANAKFSINTPACHASSSTYLESLAWCMQQKCPGEGVNTAQLKSCWDDVAGDGLQVGSWESYLKTELSETLPFGAVALTAPSLVNETTYEHSKETLLSYTSQEDYHALYSTILIAASVGFGLLVGLKFALDGLLLRISPRRAYTPAFIKKYLTTPAFFGKRHLQILPYRLGYVPQRSTSIMISLFVIINVLLNFVNPPSFTNDTWYISDSVLSNANLANRLGVLAVANLALAIMLSGRNSILMYVTGCSRTTILAFHRWAGRIAVIKGVAHGAIYLSSTDMYGTGIFTPAGALHYIGCLDLYWALGIATLALFGCILVSSIAPIRLPWYELFLITHLILAVAVLVTLWYHLAYRFNYQYGYEVWLYIAFAFWGFDRFVRVVRVGVLNRGLITGRTPPASIDLLPGGQFIKVTVYPSTSWSIKPGHYCFIYFPTLTWFFESHPFSVASWSTESGTCRNDTETDIELRSALASEDITASPVDLQADSRNNGSAPPHRAGATSSDNHSSRASSPDHFPITSSTLNETRLSHSSISFIIRPCSGITKRLHDRLAESKSPISLPVLIEGPYGRPTNSVFASDTVLVFAGGVGITGVLGHVHHYVRNSSTAASPIVHKGRFRASKFVLFWLVRSKTEIEAIKPLLPSDETMRKAGMELHIVCNQERDERLDFSTVIREEKQALSNRMDLCVLVCGPGQMADEIRRQVVKAEGLDGGRVELVEEAFAW